MRSPAAAASQAAGEEAADPNSFRLAIQFIKAFPVSHVMHSSVLCWDGL